MLSFMAIVFDRDIGAGTGDPTSLFLAVMEFVKVYLFPLPVSLPSYSFTVKIPPQDIFLFLTHHMLTHQRPV